MHLNPFIVYFTRFAPSSSVIKSIYSNSFQIWPYLTSASKLSNSSNWKLYQMHEEKAKNSKFNKIFNLDVYPKSKKCVIGIP